MSDVVKKKQHKFPFFLYKNNSAFFKTCMPIRFIKSTNQTLSLFFKYHLDLLLGVQAQMCLICFAFTENVVNLVSTYVLYAERRFEAVDNYFSKLKMTHKLTSCNRCEQAGFLIHLRQFSIHCSWPRVFSKGNTPSPRKQLVEQASYTDTLQHHKTRWKELLLLLCNHRVKHILLHVNRLYLQVWFSVNLFIFSTYQYFPSLTI